jgi:hypothetical protein
MSYLTHHHNSCWFQLRVPVPLVARYGRVLRIHLQTQDRPVAQHLAQHLAYQLAGQWLARFQAERSDPGQAISLPFAVAEVPFVLASPQQTSVPPIAPVAPAIDAPGYDDLYHAWKRLDPDRDPTIFREMRSIADQLKLFCKKPPAELLRVDVARFRDFLGGQKLARGTCQENRLRLHVATGWLRRRTGAEQCCPRLTRPQSPDRNARPSEFYDPRT